MEPVPTPTLSKTKQRVALALVVLGVLSVVIAAAVAIGKRGQSAPSATVSPTPTAFAPTASPTPKPSTTPTPKPSPTPTATPKASPSPSATPKPTTTPTPVPTTTTFSSTSNLDGFRSSNGGGNSAIEIRAGRNTFLSTRGFVSFDIASLATSAKVISAKLRLYHYKVEGNPYSTLGALIVDHLDYGSTLDNGDYDAAALTTAVAQINSNSSYEWKDWDVTLAVKNDLTAGHSRSQYRIHFSTESTGGDATGDFAYFYSSNAGYNTNPPQLVVTYN